MKRNIRKLVLAKETLKQLTPRDLKVAVGAAGTFVTCDCPSVFDICLTHDTECL